MLGLYLGMVAFGGTLLLATLVFGGDHHADGAGDGDAAAAGHGAGDAGAGHAGAVHGHHAGSGSDLLGWLPITSLRFWTFFLAFGGAVGAALTLMAVAGAGVILGVAVGVGWLLGLVAVTTVRALRRGSVDSTVGDRELVGNAGVVVVPILAGGIGKVRLEVGGRAHDLIAESDDGAAMATGARIVVVSVGASGTAVVTRDDAAELVG